MSAIERLGSQMEQRLRDRSFVRTMQVVDHTTDYVVGAWVNKAEDARLHIMTPGCLFQATYATRAVGGQWAKPPQHFDNHKMLILSRVACI